MILGNDVCPAIEVIPPLKGTLKKSTLTFGGSKLMRALGG